MGKRGNRSRRRGSSAGANGGSSSAPSAQAPASSGGRQRSQGGGTGRSGRGRGEPKRRRIEFDPEKHYLPDPIPERDYEPCALSGREIDDIFTALAEPTSGQPVRFDSVIEHIRNAHDIAEDQDVIYLGRGAFGIVSYEKGESGRTEMVVHQRFEYEDVKETRPWRRELAPGISRDYTPHPEPISDLYSREELASFPRFEPASAYQSRGN